MRRILVFALVLDLAAAVLLGCPRTPPPAPPAPDADAAPQTPSCLTSCAHMAALGCAAAQPTPGGASCVDFCSNTLDGPAALDVACLTAAVSCDAAASCDHAPWTNVVYGAKPDAGVLPPTCQNWCSRARVLHCGAAQPTVAGASCESVCENVQSGPKPFNLRCRIAAGSCRAADSCEP